jgi:hypothetical protein
VFHHVEFGYVEVLAHLMVDEGLLMDMKTIQRTLEALERRCGV